VIAAAQDLPELFLLDSTFAADAPMDGYQLCRLLCDMPEFREIPILAV
jgi:CheY-like chemotaxis protein